MLTKFEQDEFLKALYKYSVSQSRVGRSISSILIGVKSSSVNGYEPFAGDSPSVPPIGGDD